MVSLPTAVFEVELVVPAEMRWAMRAQGVIEDWLLSDAAGERPIDQLPAAELQMHVDHGELRLSWLELRADSAWQAITRASDVVEEILPELLRTRALRVEARPQGHEPEQRRPD